MEEKIVLYELYSERSPIIYKTFDKDIKIIKILKSLLSSQTSFHRAGLIYIKDNVPVFHKENGEYCYKKYKEVRTELSLTPPGDFMMYLYKELVRGDHMRTDIDLRRENEKLVFNIHVGCCGGGVTYKLDVTKEQVNDVFEYFKNLN